jgi:hypothetical protein
VWQHPGHLHGLELLRFNASSGYKNYQITDNLASFPNGAALDCNPVYTASLSVPNDAFAWAEWLYGTFRDVQSGNVYAVLYNEYYGGNYFPGPPADGYGVYVALGLGVSTNTGATFSKIQPAPNHVIVRSPYLRQNTAASYGYGWFGGIFKSPLDQMYYVGAGGAETGTTALVRTNNLNDTTSWNAWNGSDWSVPTVPLSQPYEGIGINPLYLGFSDYFKKYIAVTTGNVGGDPSRGNYQIVYNLSDDLVHWGPARKIMDNPTCPSTGDCNSILSYPSSMDPVYLSQSNNSTMASNGMIGAHPYVTYIKNVDSGATHQQFAAQQVSFDNVVFNRMDNFSVRGVVGEGQDVVMGFIIQGTEDKQFVFRALGPSLNLPADFGYDALPRPGIDLRDQNGNLLASNQGWQSLPADDQQRLTNTGLTPGSTDESALVVTLSPGSYSLTMYQWWPYYQSDALSLRREGSNARPASDAQVVAPDCTTCDYYGVGLLDAYDLSSLAEAKVAEVSVRAFSRPGNGALTMGFISRGGQQAVIRGTGTSTLAPAGFSPVIPNPYMSVYDNVGSLITSNDDWGTDSNAGLIQSYGLAPGDSFESATMFSTQTPAFSTQTSNTVFSNYSVQLQGTGYGLLELYNVNPN